MRRRKFGRTGQEVSVIGQGTWRMGGRTEAAALRAGLDAGMTHIDTAEMYEGAESIVSDAMAGRRDAVFLVSKVLPGHASRTGVAAACDASLKRLRTDRLDSYLLHWPGSHPLADTIRGFEDLKSAGKILSWGLSNFDVPELEDALAIAGPGAIACNQVLYHLQERAIEHAVMPWCRANGIALVAYSPFGSGDFPETTVAGGTVLARIAETHGTSPHAVALAFLTRAEGSFAIPKTARVERARANAEAGSLALSPDEVTAIDRAFPLGPRPRSLPML